MISRRARFDVHGVRRDVWDRLRLVPVVRVFVSSCTVLMLGVVMIRACMHVLGQRLPPRGNQDRHEHTREPPLHERQSMGRLWCGQ